MGANIWGKLKCLKFFGKSNLGPGFSIASLLLAFICFASAQNRIKYGIFNFLDQIQAQCKKCLLQISYMRKVNKAEKHASLFVTTCYNSHKMCLGMKFTVKNNHWD